MLFSKLTAEDVLEIRRKLAAGVRQVDLAAQYGVSQMQISRIKRYEQWKNIQEED